MKKFVALLAGLVAATALTVQSADAHSHKKKVGTGVIVAGVVTGAAATAGYFAINRGNWTWQSNAPFPQGLALAATSVGCAAVAPILATVLEGRELTMREAGVLTGSCIVPIIGGYLVNAAWDANPQWERFEKKPRKLARK
jgi:MFS family permease